MYDISKLTHSQIPFDFMFHEQLRNAAGLYSFWLSGNCLYVGMSDNLKRRIFQHVHNETNPELARYFDWYGNEIKISLIYLNCSKAELLDREKDAIDQLQPITNKTGLRT